MDIRKEDVESFLNDFKLKMEVFDVVFLDREKNLQALLDLEIVSANRKDKLKELRVSDYYKGPVQDQSGGEDLWEFDKTVKGKDVYIKISMGRQSKPVSVFTLRNEKLNIHLNDYQRANCKSI